MMFLVFFGVPSNLNGSISRFRKNNCQDLRGELLFLGSQWRALKYSSTPLPPYHHQRDSLKTPSGRYVGLINSHWFQFWWCHTVVPIKKNIKSIRTPLISRLGWVSDYPHYKFRIEPQTSPMFFSPFCWVNLGSPNTVRRFLRSLRKCQ